MFNNRKTTFSNLKKKIKKKKLSYGFWFQVSNADTIENFTYNKNIDWAVLDLEHGIIKKNEITDIFRALELNKISPLIRIDVKFFHQINNYLDLGAQGVILSNLNNSSELELVKKRISFSLKGGRGNGFYRANNYGNNFEEYMKVFKEPIIIPMIENTNALNDLENILKISDSVFIGPYDLSNSLGIPGKFKNSLFKRNIDLIIKKTKKYKKSAGIHCVNQDFRIVNNYKKKGFSLIAYSMDTLVGRDFNV
tara:strand:- start:4626 stop:5378 length:753 start_codon:yes stop_codon:yes gene_type:complete